MSSVADLLLLLLFNSILEILLEPDRLLGTVAPFLALGV